MTIQPNEHTILVGGSTGQQGGAVAHHLLEQGFKVRALTRNPGKQAAQTLEKQGAEIIQGDFEDRDTLDRALEGVYGAFSIQTIVEGVDAEIQQGKTFADAAKNAGIEHFIYSSVIGADRNSGVPHFESKWKIEKYIREIELPYTIFRPVFFMDNWPNQFKDSLLSGQLALPLSHETSLQQIAVDDIGAFVTLAFSNPEFWKGRAVELAGDELTMTQTTKVIGKVLNKDISYIQVPWEKYEKQMREILGEEVAKDLTLMHRWFEKEDYTTNIKTLREKYSDLRRLEPFLKEQNWK